MVMDEITFLRNENQRLNTIISALIEQVEMLKKENASLKKAASADADAGGIATSEKGIQNVIYADVENEKGINNNFNADVTFQKGTNNQNDANVSNEKGTNNLKDAV